MSDRRKGRTRKRSGVRTGIWKAVWNRPGLLLFALAFLLRLLFWQATPDAAWPGSARYAGDAGLWVELATGGGDAAELGLPLRPPATAWLLAPLLELGGLPAAQVAWCLLGALVPWLAFRAAEPAFGRPVALATGLLTAASTALLTLSTSLNNETPYLVVVMATLVVGEHLRRAAPRGRRRVLPWAAWGLLGAAGCLLRAEHALVVALLAAWLGLVVLWPMVRPANRRPDGAAGKGGRTRSAAGRRVAIPLLAAGAGLLLPLALWHGEAWQRVERFNQQDPAPGDGARHQVHRMQGRMLDGVAGYTRWTPEAEAERRRWPAFARRTATLFVELTALHRATRASGAPPPEPVTIAAPEVAVLDEAFGTRPGPLPGHPFVALYGGLNFHLANHAGADGGFSRGPLERPPPLAGGPSAYSSILVAGLPPAELALTYPPHLDAVRHGWGHGLRWLAARPADAAALVAEKLRRFWAGASLGWTGYGWPVGTAGVRWPVDLATPAGTADTSAVEIAGAAPRWWVTTWRGLLLAVALAGAVVGRPRVALAPWLLVLAARGATAAAFFGYARFGATVVPVIALLVALAAAAGLRHRAGRALVSRLPGRPTSSFFAWFAAAALLLLAVETARWLAPPDLRLDGQPVSATDPFPGDDPAARRLTTGP